MWDNYVLAESETLEEAENDWKQVSQNKTSAKIKRLSHLPQKLDFVTGAHTNLSQITNTLIANVKSLQESR